MRKLILKFLPKKIKKLLKIIISIFQDFFFHKNINDKINFLIDETQNVKKILRENNLNTIYDTKSTQDSFIYQWENLLEGKDLLTDENFKNNVENIIINSTELDKNWFKNKKVLDLGCGMGRFSYGFLNLGADLTILDTDEKILNTTKSFLEKTNKKFKTICCDILEFQKSVEQYDLVWCYGVLHHTRDTYKGIEIISDLVKQKGKLFLMLYGHPITREDFHEIAEYNHYRKKTEFMNFEKKKEFLSTKFEKNKIHGMFDAISPKINDLFTFSEIKNVLMRNNFINIKQTLIYRNFHIISTKK